MRQFLLILLFSPLLALAEDEGWGDDWAAQGDDWGEPVSDPFSSATDDDGDMDPWEGFNRRVFSFNEGVDKYAAKPLAKGYKRVTPGWINDSISRFFGNVREVRSGINHLFQLNWRDAGHNFGRFSINSTLGIAGLFDVASSVNLKSPRTDLGLTFRHWGVPDGPYVMLPFLGPSTVLDTATFYPDRYFSPIHYIPDHRTGYALNALFAVDLRASLLGFDDLIVGDRYSFIRGAYLQHRKAGDDEDWDGFEDLESRFEQYEDDDDW